MHNNIEGSVFSHRSTNLYQVGLRGLSVVQTLKSPLFLCKFPVTTNKTECSKYFAGFSSYISR